MLYSTYQGDSRVVGLSITVICRLKEADEIYRKENGDLRITISYSRGVLRVTVIIRARKNHPHDFDMLPVKCTVEKSKWHFQTPFQESGFFHAANIYSVYFSIGVKTPRFL